MKITLSNQEYTFLTGYQKDNKHRSSFNILANKVFGISFEDWYQAGFWNEKYIPYTLFDKKKAVANVSVNIMDFNVIGKPMHFIQIGTVMTDPDYRGKSLSRFLMERVLEEWNSKTDLIYLYANKSVLEMYPKFGFERAKEYEYFKSINKNTSIDHAIKLNMDEKQNRNMLYHYAKNSAVFGEISMQENADLVMFYCASFLKENVYYIKSLDVIAVVTFDDNKLHLLDVFSKQEVNLEEIILSLKNSKITEIVLGCTPKDCSSYQAREISGDDTLFIQAGKAKIFEENKLMFPILSHA